MRILGVLLAFSLAQPAHALSCLPPDLAGAYTRAAEAEESYVILKGRFDFDADALRPYVASDAEPEDRRVAARFRGGMFTGRDFSFETELDVAIEALCLGPWCAGMDPQVELLAFVEETPEGYLLRVEPCYSSLFADPDAALVARLVACHGGDCGPSE